VGRRRKHDTHLPKRMYERRGRFYFDSPVTKKWEPLGDDIAIAMAKYGQLIGPQWSGRTLGDVIERYQTRVLPLKRSAQTRKDQARELARLKKWCGHMMPDALTVPMCYRYLEERVNDDGKPVPVAARHEIALLGHVFTKAIQWGVATVNPVKAMERQPKARRTRYVTDAEFETLRKMANPRLQLAMDLARLTGQRRGDLLTLRREQLTAEGIVFKQSKTGAGVLVEWTDELKAVIERAWKMAPQIPREYVLRTRSGKPYSSAGFSAMWQRLATKYVETGGQRIQFKDLRAKAASDKDTIEEAAALLGHASTETTKRVYKRNLTRARPVK
jgi:integrase